MLKKPSRDVLPMGRPLETPSLAGIPRDNGESINPLLVCRGYASLGHISHKVISPNIGLNLARDLGYYREREEFFNVIRENETLDQLQVSNVNLNGMRCHGANSLKDYLSSTKIGDANTIGDTNASPSHQNMRNHILNQNSSGNLPEEVYSSKTGSKAALSKNNSSTVAKGATSKSQQNYKRPKTSVINSGRNAHKAIGNATGGP